MVGNGILQSDAGHREPLAAIPVWLRPGPLVLFILLLTVLRLIVAANAGLAEDEAYYRLWGLHPAAGYYDHPPMVGWWVWLGHQIAGDTALGLRLMAVLSAMVGSIALWRTTALLFGLRAAGWAVLFFNATILIGVGSLLMTPDAPSVFFWGLTIWALAELAARGDVRWWLAVGLFAGLGLTSKYSGLFLGAGIVLWLVFVPAARIWWRSWQLYAGGVLAILLVIPVVLWNADHQWASFVRQFGRAVPDGWTLKFIFEFIGSAAALLNPLIAVLAAVGFARAIAGVRRGDPAFGLILWTALPFVAYLLVHALHARVQGNWPAPLFPALCMLAAVVAARPSAAKAKVWSALAKTAVAVGVAASMLVYAHAIMPLTGALARKDPTFQTRGWDHVRDEVAALAATHGAHWVATWSYGLNGQLAFALRDRLPVEQLNERIRYIMSPELGRDRLAAPALFVVIARRDPGPERLLERFADVRQVAVITRSVRGVALEDLIVYRTADPRGDPRDPVFPLP